jgi:hypothetical protein
LNRRARINVKFKESVIPLDDNNIGQSSKVKLDSVLDVKGKSKLTSPSLDDLVNQSQES